MEAMFQLAVAEAKRARWGRRTRRREVRMYYCRHCRAYHTTSKNNWGMMDPSDWPQFGVRSSGMIFHSHALGRA